MNKSKGGFEWTATVYNLNRGKNDRLLEQCRPLSEYMELINRIRDSQKSGMGSAHIIFLLLMPDWCAKNLKYMYRNKETGNTIIRKEIRQHKKEDIDSKFLHI